MDIEALAREVGKDAWEIWRDKRGHLKISLDGVSLLPELELFAAAIERATLERAAQVCLQAESRARAIDRYDISIGYGNAAEAIRALHLSKDRAMEREKVLKLAVEAGAKFDPHWGIAYNCGTETFVRFAALVEAAEREACAELCLRTVRRNRLHE